MHYLDTSVIAAAILRDPESERAGTALAAIDEETLCLSLWTGVEVFSAISRRLRMRQLGAKAAECAAALHK